MTADLLIHNARLVATVDNARRELPGGWVAITDGLISGVGSSTDPVPEATERIDATGCLVTPGLINTHHHFCNNIINGVVHSHNNADFYLGFCCPQNLGQ